MRLLMIIFYAKVLELSGLSINKSLLRYAPLMSLHASSSKIWLHLCFPRQCLSAHPLCLFCLFRLLTNFESFSFVATIINSAEGGAGSTAPIVSPLRTSTSLSTFSYLVSLVSYLTISVLDYSQTKLKSFASAMYTPQNKEQSSRVCEYLNIGVYRRC